MADGADHGLNVSYVVAARARFFNTLIDQIQKALKGEADIAAMALCMIALDVLGLFWGKKPVHAKKKSTTFAGFVEEFLVKIDSRYDGNALYDYRCILLHNFSSGSRRRHVDATTAEVVLKGGLWPSDGHHLYVASEGGHTQVVIHVSSLARDIALAADHLFGRAGSDPKLASRIARISQRVELLATFVPPSI